MSGSFGLNITDTGHIPFIIANQQQ